MRSNVADTGPIVCFLYRDDPDHPLVRTFLRGNAVALITTWPVIAEAWHLLLARAGIKPALALMRWVNAGGLRVAAPHEDDPGALLELLERYADHPMELRSLSNGKQLSAFDAKNVTKLAATPDGTRAISVTASRVLTLWQLAP